MNAEIDISNVKLETERLILRAWKITDFDDFFEYASINGVGEKAGWEHHKSKDESLEILKMFIDEEKVFAIVLKENQKVIGSIGIEECRQNLDKNLENLLGRELGIAFSPPEMSKPIARTGWGRGWGSPMIISKTNPMARYISFPILSPPCCQWWTPWRSTAPFPRPGPLPLFAARCTAPSPENSPEPDWQGQSLQRWMRW